MTRQTHDPAKARFFALQLTRLAGVLAAGTGVLLWQTDAIGGSRSPAAGGALFVIGLLLVLIVPTLLLRRWRSRT